jgi:hypothetical protein
MPRRSRFAMAAEQWLRTHANGASVATKDFWQGLSQMNPELTSPTEGRKTPKATCMRDLRNDPTFEVGGGRIRLRC